MEEHEPAGGTARSSAPEPVALAGDNARARRRRGLAGLVGVLLFGAAAGGVAGLIGGRIAGLVAGGVVALPLLYVVIYNMRRRVWIEGSELIVRTWRSRRIDLVTAGRIDLLVTEVRGARTVALLVNAGQRRAAVKVDIAMYTGTTGRELGVLALRRLADAVIDNTVANGMIFAELLIAQLRAEARGVGPAARPLYRLASAAPAGKLAQRFTMDAVSRFVAELEET